MKYETRCVNCGLVLTSQAGVRLHSANFDSTLPNPNGPRDAAITWARCSPCYSVALQQQKQK